MKPYTPLLAFFGAFLLIIALSANSPDDFTASHDFEESGASAIVNETHLSITFTENHYYTISVKGDYWWGVSLDVNNAPRLWTIPLQSDWDTETMIIVINDITTGTVESWRVSP